MYTKVDMQCNLHDDSQWFTHSDSYSVSYTDLKIGRNTK